MWVSEGFYDKQIMGVADAMCAQFPAKRYDTDARRLFIQCVRILTVFIAFRSIVCIAGPSSSGKTTTADRLRLQLRVNGHRAMIVSMDNYYHSNESGKIPQLPDGEFGMSFV